MFPLLTCGLRVAHKPGFIFIHVPVSNNYLPSYSINMPADEEVATRAAQVAVALLVTLTVVAVPIVVPVISAIGDWFCSTDDDNPRAADHHETTRLPHQPPTSPYTRNSCTRSQSQTAGPNPATLDYYRSGSPLTSPDAGQSHQTLPASAHTQTSYQLLSTPLFSQATVRNLATTDYDRSLYDPNSAPPSAGESHQATSTSIHTQASYQRSPSPELAYISEFYQSSPTHPRTQLSPSAHLQEPTATAVGRNTLTPVVQPSPVLAALSDLDSEEPEDAEDVDTAKKLREEAQRERHEMYGALARAESAHERGDEKAERTHNQQAIVHENAINQLDTKEAGISKKNVCILISIY